MNVKLKVFLPLLAIGFFCFPQEGFEGEHRIKKSQFPSWSNPDLIPDEGIKKIRYYKETDNHQSQYRLKFKQNSLYYYMNYTADGILLNLGFRVKTVDIPSDTYTNISAYFSEQFEHSRIRRMYQEYPVNKTVNRKEVVNNAFQNLLLPDIKYLVILRAKKEGNWSNYKANFNADGMLISIRHALPQNYDHILY